jgi:hypothetical protein
VKKTVRTVSQKDAVLFENDAVCFKKRQHRFPTTLQTATTYNLEGF